MNILIVQTAFAGDLILATPLIEELARLYPAAEIDVLCIPSTAGLLERHPLIRALIVYDKRAGASETSRVVHSIRKRRYTHCVTPHRSFRSAMIAWFSRAPRRITFDKSAAPFLATAQIHYRQDQHEAERNLSLLTALGVEYNPAARARLYPPEEAYDAVKALLGGAAAQPYVCIAPGSVWATKRWTEEGFAQVAGALSTEMRVVLTGGADDAALCARILHAADSPGVISLAGRLSWLETAALVDKAALVISNDSAPVHVASAMQTPVVQIYGATVPAFGFSPWQVPHRIVQRNGLPCRPCGIHGGNSCPIGTFVCMKDTLPQHVLDAAHALLAEG